MRFQSLDIKDNMTPHNRLKQKGSDLSSEYAFHTKHGENPMYQKMEKYKRDYEGGKTPTSPSKKLNR